MALLKKKETKSVEVIKKLTIEKETENMLKAISKMYGYDYNSKEDLNEVLEELLKQSLKRKVKMPREIKEYVDLTKIEISEDTALKLYEFGSDNNYDSDSPEEVSELVNKLLISTLNKDKEFKKFYEKHSPKTENSLDTQGTETE